MSTNTKYKNTNKFIHYVHDDIIAVINDHLNSNNTTNIIVPQAYNCFNGKDHRFASVLFDKFPIVKTNLEMLRTNPDQCFGKTQFIEVFNNKNKNFGKVIFANMLCQRYNGSKRHVNYIMLGKCMHSINIYLQEKYPKTGPENITIYAPKFGVGSAGGNWNFIEDLIKDAWSLWNVTIYSTR